MNGRLLATISIVLFVAGIVTGNLNSTVWAKDDYKPDARFTFGLSENTNKDINTPANANGNSPANANGNSPANANGNSPSDTGNSQTNNSGSHSCDSECQKTINDAMDTIDNLF